MKRRLLYSLIAVAVLMLLMRYQGYALVGPGSPRGIVDLEFAWTETRFTELMSGWNRDTVLKNLLLDFVFIMAYGWFLAEACRWARARYRSAVVRVFGPLVLSACLCDVIENVALLARIGGHRGPAWLPLAGAFAAAKFATLAIVLLYLLFTILFRRRAAPMPEPAV